MCRRAADLTRCALQIAQEKYGQDFNELPGRERQSVAGQIGGERRKEQVRKQHEALRRCMCGGTGRNRTPP